MSAARRTAVAHLVAGSAPQAFVTVVEAVEDQAHAEGITEAHIEVGDGFRRLISLRRWRQLRKLVGA